MAADEEQNIGVRLEEAIEYKDFVLKELRKREQLLGEVRAVIRELKQAGADIEPHRFVKAGDVAAIRTIAQSRKENARLLEIEEKRLAEAKEDLERARDRLEMAKEEIEELKGLMRQEKGD